MKIKKIKERDCYISVRIKFIISICFAILWLLVSIYLSIPWVKDLATIISYPLAIIVIAGIAYIPGYMNTFLVVSLLLDRQPKLKYEDPNDDITILIPVYNEQDTIYDTIRCIANQDYKGNICIIVIDNNSTDNTLRVLEDIKKEIDLNIIIIHEEKQGKFYALNNGLKHVSTQYLITLDSDTLLHMSAIRYLVSRIKSSPSSVCAVAGNVLSRNSRASIITKMQEWDYFLGISSIKRTQGMYQSTLVAQGAYSIYKTDAVIGVGGWTDAIGEDIVLTWEMLSDNCKIYYEPLAVAFTDTPKLLKHFAKQRARWARGMIEGLKYIGPWKQKFLYSRYLTATDLIIPYIDICYTLGWIPGLILALFGYYWIVGIMSLLVLPITLFSFFIAYFYQKNYVFKKLNLKIRKNRLGFILFILFYQIIMSPVSVWGYIQELFKMRRVWK